MADTNIEGAWPIQLDIVGPNQAIAERSQFQMRATLTYDNGAKVTVTPSWSVMSVQYGDIDAETGIFTAGSVTSGRRPIEVRARYYDTETDNVFTASFVVYIKDIDIPPNLVNITIAGEKTVEKDTTQEYLVTANFDNGSTQIVSPSAFVSSRPGVATIDANGHAVFQKIRGSATVRFTASYTVGTITRSASIDVLVQDFSIYPSSASIFGPSIITELGKTSFGLEILFENGKNQQVLAQWYSTNPKAGHISCDGSFCAAAVDKIENTTIIATYDYEGVTVSASLDLSVLDITVKAESLIIEGPARVREGLVVQYYTTVQFTDGTRKAVKAKLHSGVDAGYIDDGNQFHAISSVAVPKPVNILATFEDLQATRIIDVIPSPVKPVSAYIDLRSPMHVGEHQVLKFHVVYEDGADIVLPATWSVSNLHIASISDSGVLHAVQVFETAELVVRAQTSVSGVLVEAELPVVLLDNKTYPTSIRIDGPESCRAGVVTPLTAFATFSDGSERAVNPLWYVEPFSATVDLGAFKASTPGKYAVSVSYVLQHETVTATKEISVS